jgi:hypothetical protein
MEGSPALDPAQLSSLSTALDDLTKRVTRLADELAGSPRQDVAASLYEVERLLGSASRRMTELVRQL